MGGNDKEKHGMRVPILKRIKKIRRGNSARRKKREEEEEEEGEEGRKRGRKSGGKSVDEDKDIFRGFRASLVSLCFSFFILVPRLRSPSLPLDIAYRSG